MQPAISVIFFTVTAGAGYGLLFFLALTRVANLTQDISPDQIPFMGLIGLLLVTAGLVSSTFHLANPRNAWRSFTRFKTSWLSREAVFAVLFYPVCLLWLSVEWLTGNTLFTTVLALMTALLCIVVLLCTAMIYASLKTIRQWHSRLVPVNFVLLGLLSGALILAFMFAQQQLEIKPVVTIAIVILALSAVSKAVYFFIIGKPAGPTIGSALGFTQATVRLLDVGHSGETFHTREFGYEIEQTRLIWLRIICLLLAFALPFILLSGAFLSVTQTTIAIAFISAYAGIFIERWLFFAEARHVVNLYHGAQST